MRKFIAIFFLFAILSPAFIMAQTTGILQGKVVDETGKGLIGATLLVEGTQKGLVIRDKEGNFTLINIPAGEWTVKVSFVGKTTLRKQVRVSINQTTKVNFELQDETTGKTTQSITVTGEKLVQITEGTKDIKSNKEITNTAREGISGVIAMSSGVLQSGGGFIIRGSRTSESKILVDGVEVTNQFTGGFGSSGSTYFPMVSTYATEEVQVMTGGFGAEYGNVTGGVVSTAVKTGKDDRYEGYLRYQTELGFLYGSQANSLKLIKEGAQYKAIDYGEGKKLQSSGQNVYDFSLGGPMPFLKEYATFSINANFLHEPYRNASYEIYDPWGNNLGHLPNNGSWTRNLYGKLNIKLNKSLDLELVANYGVASFESSSWSWIYSDTEGWVYDKDEAGNFVLKTTADGKPVTNGIPDRIARQNVLDQFVNSYRAKMKYTLSPTSILELNIMNASDVEENARRVGMEDPSFFGGFEKWEPIDAYRVDKGRLVPGVDNTIDYYQNTTSIRYTEDGYFKMDLPQRNPISGYFEGPSNSTGSHNPYGIASLFATTGGGAFSFRSSNYWQLDGIYQQFLTLGDFSHNLRIGFEAKSTTLDRHYNGSPYESSPFYDIYTDKWGGNIYAQNEKVREETSKPYNPLNLSIYVSDQIKYKGIDFSPSLRFDYFDANAKYRLNTGFFTSISADSGFATTQAKYQLSPRMSVSYPITASSNIRLSYGWYFKIPTLQLMYDNFNLDYLRTGNIVGNPNLEPEKTNNYEASYNVEVVENLRLGVTTYYKDIYNQVGMSFIQATPDPYYQYIVAEYGSSRGVEFLLRKQSTLEDHFGFDLSYTLAYLTGTADAATSNYGVTIDPYTNLPTFPLAEYPLGRDIRHHVKANIMFEWGNDQGPTIGDLNFLQNMNISFTFEWRSGVPYTKTDISGKPISEINSERQPSYWGLDMVIRKTVPLIDVFGDMAGDTKMEFYAYVYNLLDIDDIRGLNSATGDPIDNGRIFNRQYGDFNSTTYYEDAVFENPSTYTASQYDSYGNRIYNAHADFDNNGAVTQSETYEAYYRYVEDALKFRGNFRAPRTVTFGMLFRF